MDKLSIYNQMYPKLLHYAVSFVNNATDAHDVLQKVYIYLNNKDTKTFNDEKHIENWLIWLTKSECICINKKNKKYVAIEDDEMNNKMCESDSPFENLCKIDLKEQFLKKLPIALNKLSPLQKKATKLYFLEGKDRNEISKMLKSTKGAVSAAISKSIKYTIFLFKLHS
jgi:RNA polymerase sigma factor (sigma-70 family)